MQGTGRFFSEMAPRGGGLTSGGAKELMLKDTDYSSTTDHYFAYLKKLKEEAPEIVREE
jgi:hypothetical protein